MPPLAPPAAGDWAQRSPLPRFYESYLVLYDPQMRVLVRIKTWNILQIRVTCSVNICGFPPGCWWIFTCLLKAFVSS